jgi:hypothetical protein
MAAFNKFLDFVEQLGKGVHQLHAAGHTLKCMLVNSPAPVNTNTVKADLTEISAGNGYTAGGEDTQNDYAESGGTGTLSGTKIVWTCVTAAMAAFRYVILYNDTPTSPADPLIGWWDYGSSLTLNVGETFSVKFNNSDTTGTILTIA